MQSADTDKHEATKKRGLETYDELTQTLLRKRGIETEEDAERFFNPSYERDVHDPMLLPNMARACERILRAIEQGEHIAIFSDYDTDGIPGAVLFSDFLDAVGHERYRVYIPHRVLEGFGMNEEAVLDLAKENISLIITIDCASSDIGPITLAKEKGIDVIVTDHHLVPNAPPPAYAIVNPQLPESVYPNPHLCGAGVAFQLVRALLDYTPEKEGKEDAFKTLRARHALVVGWEKWLLDMVGIATLSDMVPLLGENRALAHFGLVVLRKTPRKGIRALCERLRVAQKNISEEDVGFSFGPRINAASRMGVPYDAFLLLKTKNSEEATTLARSLDLLNTKRKGGVASIVREVKKRLRVREDSPVLVTGDPKWKPSLLGLVANTLASEYQKPVFLWGREDGSVIKGSCRSYGGVNLVRLMEGARESFIDIGGHPFSGGFSLEHSAVHTLEERLSESFLSFATPQTSGATVSDTTLPLSASGYSFVRSLQRFAPFGEGNEKPVVLFEKVEVVSVIHFGKHEEHLKVRVRDSSGTHKDAIAFFTKATKFDDALGVGKEISLLGSVEASSFGGRSEVRIRLCDVVPL